MTLSILYLFTYFYFKVQLLASSRVGRVVARLMRQLSICYVASSFCISAFTA